jgi:tetratricopeptide (TPR) repeat protein
LLAVVLSAALGASRVGWAATPVGSSAARIRDARAHYEQAVSHYNLDEFAPALAEFREAYRLKPDPSFLFNIAQCHRKLGQTEAALDYYRKYLRNLPNAANREDVEHMIADLHARGGADPDAKVSSALVPPADAPAAVAAPAPVAVAPAPLPVAPPLASPAPEVVSLAAPPPAAASAPIYRRWWFWTSVAVVAVAGGLLAAHELSSSADPYGGNLAPGIVRLEVR